MRKLLVILTIVFALSVNTYATKNIVVVKEHQSEDTELKLTIDLYNITKYSTKNLEARINSITKNFLTKDDAKYVIVIKASLDPAVNINSMSFKIEIKGTLEEVKKELETIGTTIDEMRNPVE